MKLKAGVALTVDRAGKFDAFNLLHKDVKRLNSEVQRSGKQLRAMRRNSDSTRSSLAGLARGASVVAIGFGAWRLAQRADQVRLLEARIQRVTALTSDYGLVMEDLTNIAFDNGVALKGTADLFINIQRSAKDLGASNESALQLTNTVQQLGVISGASTEAMKNSLRQLSQAFAGNVFRAEEWNSVVENTPEIANRIAQGMGKTVGQLRLMVVAGELLSKDVFEVLLKQSNDIQKDFEKMPLTMDRATNRLWLNFDRLLDSINDSTSATAGLADLINDVAVGLGEAADYVSNGELEVDFSTWIDFADAVGEVSNNISTAIELIDDLGGKVDDEALELTIADVFLDFPIWVEAAYKKIRAYTDYSIDYIKGLFSNLGLQLDFIWLSVVSSFSKAFHSMNVIASDISKSISYKLADVFTAFGDGAKAIGKAELAQKSYKLAQDATFKGTKAIMTARREQADALIKNTGLLELNSVAINKNMLNIEGSKIARDIAIKSAEGMVVAIKDERLNQKFLNDEMNRAIAQFDALDREHRKASGSSETHTGSIKLNTKALKAAEKAAKKLAAERKKAAKELLKANKVQIKYAAEVAKGSKYNFLLTKSLKGVKDATKIAKLMVQGYTDDQAKHLVVLAETARQNEEYSRYQDDVSEKIKANNILITQGTEAYKKHIFQLKYGTDANYELAKSQEAATSSQNIQIEAWNSVEDAMFDAITNGVQLLPELEKGVKAVTDSLLQAVTSGGSFSKVIGNIGGLYSSEGGLTGAFANYQTGSQLTSLFTDSQAAQIGGGIGAAIGSIWGPWGSAAGNVVGSLIGDLFSSDPLVVSATLGGSNIAAQNIGAGGSKDGFYNTARNHTGEDFERDGGLGVFGVISGESIHIGHANYGGPEEIEAIQATLDSIEALDSVFASLLSDEDINKITNNLASFEGDMLSGVGYIKERTVSIIDAMNPVLSELVDTSLPLEDITIRIAEIAYAANIASPALSEFGLNIGFGDDATAAALGLIELSGGIDNLIGLTDNYVSKLFTQEEQLLISQGQAAQSIASIAAEYGLAANDLDEASELRARIELLNAGGLATADAQKQLVDLLGIVDQVALLDDKGLSATSALAGVPENLRDIIGGVTALTTPYEEIMNQTADIAEDLSSATDDLSSVANDYLPTAVTHFEDVVDTLNNVIAPDFSNDLQQQLDAQQKSNALQEENNNLQKQNISLLNRIAASQDQIASDSAYAAAGAGQ